MTPLTQSFVNEVLYVAGVYGAVSFGRNHLPVSPRTAVILIVAIKAISFVSAAFVGVTARKTYIAENKFHDLLGFNLVSNEDKKAAKDEIKKWNFCCDMACKLYHLIPNVILGLGVASNFISPGVAVAVAGVDNLCRNVFNGSFGFKDPEIEVFQVFKRC